MWSSPIKLKTKRHNPSTPRRTISNIHNLLPTHPASQTISPPPAVPYLSCHSDSPYSSLVTFSRSCLPSASLTRPSKEKRKNLNALDRNGTIKVWWICSSSINNKTPVIKPLIRNQTNCSMNFKGTIEQYKYS